MIPNPSPERFICTKHRHVWPAWEQGGTIMANGYLPGEVCQCGEMIIIDEQCTCGNSVQRAVRFDSREAIAWGGPEE